MDVAVIKSRALRGLDAIPVTVEVHLANGLPCLTLVGLADTEVKEARERVRAALQSCGLELPFNKRITINLAPADLPKNSGGFDLPLAVGLLTACGWLDAARVAGFEFAGELSLTGDLRPTRGALIMALALHRMPEPPAAPSLVLPLHSAHEAARVPNARVFGVAHLLDVVAHFVKDPLRDDLPPALAERIQNPGDGWQRIQPAAARPAAESLDGADLSEVKGQPAARRALEIAAAGGHGLLLVGPPGTGKSMLAHRFAGLLPPMSLDEALEAAAVASLNGPLDAAQWMRRPTASPHHSASAVALVGGASPPRPGEISKAHNGVLFLDELPEFPRSALEALREPLENGYIRIVRAARSAEFPARFQLIAAMNPCPCGYRGSTAPSHPPCRCSPDSILRYQGRLSGPLLDRIDMHVEVQPVCHGALLSATRGEDSNTVRQRVVQAHARALARQGQANQWLAGAALDRHARATADACRLLEGSATRLGWSGRGLHRALKVARTIADLAGCTEVQAVHVAEAVQLRRVMKSE